jgi:hypothetical protein
MTQDLFCQSCAMPLRIAEDFGSNADKSQNKDYCSFCYQEGKFTEPSITVDEMVQKCEGMMQEMDLPAALIAQAQKIIPTLKRWN